MEQIPQGKRFKTNGKKKKNDNKGSQYGGRTVLWAWGVGEREGEKMMTAKVAEQSWIDEMLQKKSNDSSGFEKSWGRIIIKDGKSGNTNQ